MNHEESYRISVSIRFYSTRSDGNRFSPVRREDHNDQRSDDVCAVHELHHLYVLQLLLSHDVLLSDSSVLRRRAVLCSQRSARNARLEALRGSEASR
jgi:hypothetical protein